MENSIKQNLISRLKQVGAYDVRIADPSLGFEHSLEGKHPLELWKPCRAVVSFAVASSPKSNNTYIGPLAPWKGDRKLGPVPKDIQSDDFVMERLNRLFFSSVALAAATFLQSRGFQVSFIKPQFKLCAYEAGIGVYGRAGFIVHPVLGSRIRLWAMMTDAPLEPDGRLEGFDPCKDCDACIRSCPAKAFDSSKTYPHSYSREKCVKKRAEIADKRLYCHNCNAVCPAGQINDEDLLCIREAVSFYKPHRKQYDATN